MSDKPTYEELEKKVQELEQAEYVRSFANKALSYSEKIHKTLIKNIPGMVYRAYPDWSADIFSGCEDLCGYTIAELNAKEKNWLSIIHPNDMDQVFQGGSVMAVRPATLTQIYRIIDKLGDIRWVEDHKTSFVSPIGGFISIDGVIFDITQRKKAEKKLVCIAQEWQKTFDTTNDAIWVLDRNQHIKRCNKKAEELFQVSSTKMIGKHCWEVAHGTEYPIQGCPNLRAKLSLKRESMELQIGKGWFQVNVDPILDAQGQYAGVVHIITDITDLKEAQKNKLQASQMESISTLSGGIAHDFNNLLSVIMGNIELAEAETELNNKNSKFLNSAKKASMQASELTRQLITFSKGGSPIKKLGSITDLLKEVVNMVLADTNVTCKFDLATELWSVEFDKIQMVHAINNLLVNAVESMPDGGSIIIKAENFIVKAKQRLPITKGEYIKISIRDQGVGIAKKNLSLVFDPYFSTKEMGSRKGMGLGLTTTYATITRHDGYITVKSDPGIGSCFTIYLSAYEKIVDAIGRQRILKSEKESARTGKILLMDDKKMIRDLGEQMLNVLGYDAHLAKNGYQAIQLYKKALEKGKLFDAVILNLTIKEGMGGKEAIKKIIKLDPYAKSIVSSGYSNDPVMIDYREYGFVGVLPKPYTVENLREELNKATKE